MFTAAIVLIVSVTVFAVLGVPPMQSLVLACVRPVAVGRTLDALPILAQRMFAGRLQYSLLAIFFLVLTGVIIQYEGLSRRLVDFTGSLVGHISGGASLAYVVACIFFTITSGPAVAITAAAGGIIYPELKRLGHPEDYAAALPTAVEIPGVAIPSSVLLILYGNVANVSPGKLLMAGVILDLMRAFLICIMYYVSVKRKSYLRNEGFGVKVVIKALKNSVRALLMSIIILGRIYTGTFTPMESDVAAAAYGLVCVTTIYWDMDLALSKRVIKESCRTIANVMILCMAATFFSYLFTIYQIPTTLSRFLIANASSRYVFMTGVVILLLFLGMFTDVVASILTLAPMLAPVAVAFGVDPIQLGLIFVPIMTIGQATSPFGTNLFVACGYSGGSVMPIGKYSLIFCSASVPVVLLCMIFSGISTLLSGITT